MYITRNLVKEALGSRGEMKACGVSSLGTTIVAITFTQVINIKSYDKTYRNNTNYLCFYNKDTGCITEYGMPENKDLDMLSINISKNKENCKLLVSEDRRTFVLTFDIDFYDKKDKENFKNMNHEERNNLLVQKLKIFFDKFCQNGLRCLGDNTDIEATEPNSNSINERISSLIRFCGGFKYLMNENI